VDVNAALKRAFVLLFSPSQPNDSAYDRISSRCVGCQYFAGPLPAVKDRSWRCSGSDFTRNLQMAERSAPTPEIVPFTVTRGRYLVGSKNLSVYYNGEFLVPNADHQFNY
jgi:hypothetical protein